MKRWQMFRIRPDFTTRGRRRQFSFRSTTGCYMVNIIRLPGSRKCIVCFVREKSGWITAGGEGGVGCHFQSNPQLVIELSPAVNGQCSVGSWWGGFCIGGGSWEGGDRKGGGEDGNERSKDLRSICCVHQRGVCWTRMAPTERPKLGLVGPSRSLDAPTK